MKYKTGTRKQVIKDMVNLAIAELRGSIDAHYCVSGFTGNYDEERQQKMRNQMQDIKRLAKTLR